MKLSFTYFTVIIIVISSFFYSCGGKEETTEKKPKKIPLVNVQEVSKSKLVSSIDITGTVQANIVTEVKSPADGFIDNLYARENQYVEKDKLIAVINPTDRVSLISSSIQQVESLERKLQSADKSSSNNLEIEAELAKAKLDLDYAKNIYQTIPVVCSLSGLVTYRSLDKGSQVSTKDIILTVTDMNSLVVKAEVNEKYFESIKQGKKLSVLLNAYPNDTLVGIISLVYPQIDASTRSVNFDVKLQNFKKSLLPGMMASIKIPVSIIENALSIPEQSVLTSPDNKNFLFVINKDSLAIKRIVQTGITMGNKIEITKGLKETDKVVVSGQDMLKDSVKVKILKK